MTLPSRKLDELRSLVEDEGLEPGTDRFKARLVQLKIEKCWELHGAPCPACPAQFDCVLRLEFSGLKAKANIK